MKESDRQSRAAKKKKEKKESAGERFFLRQATIEAFIWSTIVIAVVVELLE